MSALAAPPAMSCLDRFIQQADRSNGLPSFDVDALDVELDRILFASEDDMYKHFEFGTLRLIGDSWALPLNKLVRQWAWVDGHPVIVEYPAVSS